jgi:glycosyltransferase involved in cell wall biosynthesis
MRRFDGIEVIVSESGAWSLTSEIWKPVLKKSAKSSYASRRPDIIRETASFRNAALPRDIKVQWRGVRVPGDSMGNVTFESLLALQKSSGLRSRLAFAPVKEWHPPSDQAIKRDKKWRPVLELPRRLSSQGGVSWEIQVPGLWPAKKEICVRYIFHEYGIFPDFPLRSRDIIWSPSTYVAQHLKRCFPRNKIIVVPHGIDPDFFYSRNRPARGRKFRFLYLGATTSRKGFDLVWDAFAKEQHRMPDAELVVKAFPTTSGFIWDEIYKKRKGVRIIDKIMTTREIGDLMRSCDALVAPSRAEGFGIPVLEAMSCGLPVIVPNGTAMDDFCPADARFSVQSELVGFKPLHPHLMLIEPRLASLRREMRRAYENPELAAEKGKRGAEIARIFTWDTVTRMLILKIKDALERAR